MYNNIFEDTQEYSELYQSNRPWRIRTYIYIYIYATCVQCVGCEPDNSQTMTQVEKHWKFTTTETKLSKTIILSCPDTLFSCGRPGGFDPIHTHTLCLHAFKRKSPHTQRNNTLVHIKIITDYSLTLVSHCSCVCFFQSITRCTVFLETFVRKFCCFISFTCECDKKKMEW